MKQRGKFVITTVVLELLASTANGMTQTKIMQCAVLNYPRVKRYCSIMLQQGLIEHDLNTHHFKITQRGRKVLRLSEELVSDVATINGMIERYSFAVPKFNAGLARGCLEWESYLEKSL